MLHLPPKVLEWLAVPFYWIHMFWLAIRDTYNLVVARPLGPFTVVVIIWLLTLLVQRYLYDSEAVTHGMRPAFSAVMAACLVGFLIFVFFLFATPARVYEEQRKRAATAEAQLKVQEAELGQTRQRLVEVVQQLPPPELTPDQRSRLERSLRELGSRTVSIQYVDSPTARADPFAWRLTEVFRSAGWHVEIRGEQWGHLNYKKLMMRIEDITSIRPNQKAVLDALQRASISCGLLPGHNVADRVELIVGEM